MIKINLQNKKKLVLIISAMILLLVTSLFWFNRRNKSVAQSEPIVSKKKVQSPVNVIPVAERPYLRLEPSADGHYITIKVEEVKKNAQELNYEMEYQTGSMLQGFGGLLRLDKLPIAEKKLFGSQSAGGAITYHEDIKGGNFLAQFIGQENYAVKSAWRYFTNSDHASSFSSQDTKFSITNQDLAKYSYLIVYNSPGYPGKIDQQLLTDPYVVSAEKSLKLLSSQFEVSIRSNEAGQIMGYDGSKWQKMDSRYENGVVKANGPFMDIYLLVKS